MTTKRPYATGKRNRKAFRFTPQITDLIAEWAAKLGLSESELVATVLFAYLSNPRNFIAHKESDSAWIKEQIPGDGIIELQAKNGKRIWWDSDKDKIVKVK